MGTMTGKTAGICGRAPQAGIPGIWGNWGKGKFVPLQTLFATDGSQGDVGAEGDGEVVQHAQDKVGGEWVERQLRSGGL